jgi:hypothetical protein
MAVFSFRQTANAKCRTFKPLSKLVRIAGFEPAKASFTALPASAANDASLSFITRRVANKSFCLQVFYSKQWQLRVKNLVQLSCKILICAKSMSPLNLCKFCANFFRLVLHEILTLQRTATFAANAKFSRAFS